LGFTSSTSILLEVFPLGFFIILTDLETRLKYFYNKGDFDSACKFSKEAYRYAEKIYKKYPTEDFKRVIRLNKAFYWRTKAILLKNALSPDHSQIAKCYEEAARNSEERERYKDLANSYKHKAIAVKSNPEKFFENIAKSIEFETKLGVEEVKNYLEKLKNNHLLLANTEYKRKVKGGYDLFPYISILTKCTDIFLETAKELDKLWEFLSLIIQSERTIYYYREDNKDTSKVSKEAYKYAKEIYEKYPSEDVERLIHLNETFYWRATAELLKDEPSPRHLVIANAYEKAARTSEKGKIKSYKDWENCYKHKALASKKEPEQFFENVLKAIEYATKAEDKEAKDFLEKELMYERLITFSRIRNLEEYMREFLEIVEKTGKRDFLPLLTQIASAAHYYKEREIEKSLKFWKDACERAKEIREKYPEENVIERIISLSETYQWRTEAERWRMDAELLKETPLQRNNLSIADDYKKAAQFSEKYDEKEAYKDWENHYKYRSLAFKNRPEKFLENISKALEYAIKVGDEKARNYLENLKHERLVAFSYMGDFKDCIDNLKKAKEICYKNKDFKSAKLCEFLYYYTLSNKAVKEEKFGDALHALNKVIKIAEDIEFPIPKLFSSKDALIAEQHKVKGKKEWSDGKFRDASNSFNEVLKKEANKRDRKHYEILKNCADILSKSEDAYSESDLKYLTEQLLYLSDNPLRPETEVVIELLRDRVRYCLRNIHQSMDLEKNKLDIIKVIGGEEIAGKLEWKRRVEDEIEEWDWLSKLPRVTIKKADKEVTFGFGEEFDRKVHKLDDMMKRKEPVKEEIQGLESLLEFYLRIITEFNAKILWGDDWKRYIEEHIKNKDFFSFTFGECLKIFKLIKKEGMKKYEFYHNIREEVLELLDKHVSLRGDVSHEKKIVSFKGEEPKELQREILMIMYSLLPFFPLCFKVESTYYRPYRATLLWEAYPRDINIGFERELNEGEFYYMDQKSFEDQIQKHPDERYIEPEVVTTATSLKEYLGIKNEFSELTFVEETYGMTPDALTQLTPKDAAGWLKKASSLYKLGKYEETMGCLEECLKIEPKNVSALIKKGEILSNKFKKHTEALKYLDDALKLDPKNVLGWHNKGNIFYELEKYPDAIKCYEEAITFNPMYAPAWSNKGEALFKLDKYEEAVKCYERSLEINHENVFVWIKKGETINRLGEHEEALKCFERVLELNPEDREKVIALHNKGFILGKMGKNKEALECFNEVLEKNPEYALAWNEKGFVLIDMKRYEEAIKCFGNAIEHFEKKLEEDPDIKTELVRSWIGRGEALGKLGKYKEALECINKALELNPEDAFGWYIMGCTPKSRH